MLNGYAASERVGFGGFLDLLSTYELTLLLNALYKKTYERCDY